MWGRSRPPKSPYLIRNCTKQPLYTDCVSAFIPSSFQRFSPGFGWRIAALFSWPSQAPVLGFSQERCLAVYDFDYSALSGDVDHVYGSDRKVGAQASCIISQIVKAKEA